MRPGDRSEKLARSDPFPGQHGWTKRFVGGADAVGVAHHHDSPSGDRTGEGDDPAPGRKDGILSGGREVDSAVAGPVARHPAIEGPDHHELVQR